MKSSILLSVVFIVGVLELLYLRFVELANFTHDMNMFLLGVVSVSTLMIGLELVKELTKNKPTPNK